MNLNDMCRAPIFFARNRVRRVYTGGKLFSGLCGDEDRDSLYPEEWIASCVRALNEGGAKDEGLSYVRGTDMTLADLIAACPSQTVGAREDLGILVKYLDSAVRLPVQVHPDTAFAARHLGSRYGKTEMWLVLGTRESARLYLGFLRPCSMREFTEALAAGGNAVLPLLNEVVPRPGEVYLIPARLVHAIGAGCLVLEVQEPTDFTIQPEPRCGDYALSEQEMYLGLDRDTALSCFDFSLWGEAALRAARRRPRLLFQRDGCRRESLITARDTPRFLVNRITLTAGSAALTGAPGVYAVTEGEGALRWEEKAAPLKRGDYFLLPTCMAGRIRAESPARMQLVECLPSSPR